MNIITGHNEKKKTFIIHNLRVRTFFVAKNKEKNRSIVSFLQEHVFTTLLPSITFILENVL